MAGYGIIVPLLPFYARQFGVSAAFVGLLASLYAATQMFGGPFLGGLSDRVGRRPVLLACLLGASFAYLLLGLADSVTLLVSAVAIAGVMGGTPATAQAYIADSTTPEQRTKGLGIIGAAFGLGLMAGPALGGILSIHSLGAPAFAASALALANAAFGYFALRESLPVERRSSTTAALRFDPFFQVGRVLGISSIRLLLVTVFLLNLSFAGLLTNFPLFSEARFGWGPTRNAFFFAFVGVCAVVTQGVLIGSFQRRLGEKKLLVTGLFMAAFGFALMATVPSEWMLYPVVGAMAVGIGLAIPSLASLISRRVSGGEQGRLMGGQQAILSLTLIIGPVLAGLSFDNLGVSAPYWMGSLLAASALLAALTFVKRDREGIN